MDEYCCDDYGGLQFYETGKYSGKMGGVNDGRGSFVAVLQRRHGANLGVSCVNPDALFI